MDGPDLDEILRRFEAAAEASLPRAPLYSRLSRGVAGDPATARLLLHAPPAQRLPVLLFACVHWLLLDDTTTDEAVTLRGHYPNLTDPPAAGDPYPSFRSFCSHHEPLLAGLLASRTTQTNEVGRCAVLLPALGLLTAEVGPLALLDVGTSGGLTLLADRYHYRYETADGTADEVGPADASVTLVCGTRGAVPVPAEMPAIVARLGLDRDPVDLLDDDAARWLEACVWPDQADRFHRLRAAIGLARDDPPAIASGDAIDDLAATVARLPDDAHVVVTNTWVLNYLATEEQRAYVAALEGIGAERDLSWVMAESPYLTPGLPWPTGVSSRDDPTGADATNDGVQTHLVLTRWRGGERSVEPLGTCHPHGFWLHWRSTTTATM